MKLISSPISLLLACVALLASLFQLSAVSAHWDKPLSNAEADSVSESQYWDLVESSHQVILKLKGKSPAEIQQGVDALESQWLAVRAVAYPGGQTVAIDNSFLLLALQAPKPDLGQLENIFSTLLIVHRTYPSHIYTSVDLETLQTILARPEFRDLNQPANPVGQWLQSLWDSFVQWLASLLQKLVGKWGGAATLGNGWETVLEILSIAVLVFVLAYAARSVFVDFIAQGELSEAGNDPDATLTAEDAFAKAQGLSRGGDHRSAVRYLYLSALLLLNERGLLRYDHSKTNREFLRSVSNAPELAQPLRDIIDVFDRVWYGYHPLDEDSFQHYSRRVEELRTRTR